MTWVGQHPTGTSGSWNPNPCPWTRKKEAGGEKDCPGPGGAPYQELHTPPQRPLHLGLTHDGTQLPLQRGLGGGGGEGGCWVEDRWPRARQRKDGKAVGWGVEDIRRRLLLDITQGNKGCLFLGGSATSLPTPAPTPTPAQVPGGRNPQHRGLLLCEGPDLRGRVEAPGFAPQPRASEPGGGGGSPLPTSEQ